MTMMMMMMMMMTKGKKTDSNNNSKQLQVISMVVVSVLTASKTRSYDPCADDEDSVFYLGRPSPESHQTDLFCMDLYGIRPPGYGHNLPRASVCHPETWPEQMGQFPPATCILDDTR